MLEVLLEYVRIVEELRTLFSHEASICYGYRVPSTANRYRVCDDAHTTRPFRIHTVVMGSDQASQPRGIRSCCKTLVLEPQQCLDGHDDIHASVPHLLQHSSVASPRPVADIHPQPTTCAHRASSSVSP